MTTTSDIPGDFSPEYKESKGNKKKSDGSTPVIIGKVILIINDNSWIMLSEYHCLYTFSFKKIWYGIGQSQAIYIFGNRRIS